MFIARGSAQKPLVASYELTIAMLPFTTRETGGVLFWRAFTEDFLEKKWYYYNQADPSAQSNKPGYSEMGKQPIVTLPARA